jgi:DNA-binding response OmpR family regulator
VEDNEATRYLVARMLEREGFEVCSVASGREALEALQVRPDAVVLDVKLPDTTGFQLCQHLRADARTAVIPIVHLSASHPSLDDRRYGISVGADDYLVQPVDPSVLAGTLRRLLSRRPPAPAS